MEAARDSDQWTHEAAVVSAREALVEELGIDASELAKQFLAVPIGPRVRAGGVRAGLARFAVESLAAVAPGPRFGGYNEISDEVTVHLPAAIPVRADLALPVLSPVLLKLAPFATGLVDRGAAAEAADLLSRKSPAVAEAARRLRESPPAFDGWTQLTQVDVARAFDQHPPLVADRKELYQRLRLACVHAVERSLLDELAQRNPGFSIISNVSRWPVR